MPLPVPDSEFTAMSVNDLTRDGQPHSGSWDPSASVTPAIEPIEHVGQVLGLNSAASVTDH